MLTSVLPALRSVVLSRAALVAESVALRQQLAVLHRRLPRARLRARDQTLRLVFPLPLRQAEGFVGQRLALMGLDPAAPDDTTLSGQRDERC